VTLGLPVVSSGIGGAQKPADANGSAGSPRSAYRARRSSSRRMFGWSRKSRSSPFTLKTRAFALTARSRSAPERKTECSRNSAKLVFVATPEMPLIDTCAPRVPSRNSMLT